MSSRARHASAVREDMDDAPGHVRAGRPSAPAGLLAALAGAELLALSGIAPAPHARLAFAGSDALLAAGLASMLALAVASLAARGRRGLPWELLVPPGLALLAGFLADLTAAVHPHTWDRALWSLEAPLWRPVFAVLPPGGARWQTLGFVVAPALAMAAITLALAAGRSSRVGARALGVTLTAFVAQCAVPATGPWAAAHLPAGVPGGMGPMGPFPRVAFPSTLASWALLAWMESASLPRGRRGLARAFAIGATLALVATGLTWLAALPASAAVVLLARRLGRDALFAPSPDKAEAGADRAARGSMAVVAAMFFVSGAAGLVYEVVFAKALALTFGSMARATQTVLATYMAGMALGAWLGGRVAARRPDALRVYAVCELAIGASGALMPLAFAATRALYVASAFGSEPGSPWLVLEQVALGALVLLPPTLAMGMTLPILARVAERAGDSLGRGVALLYGMNTLGAAAGALAAGYVVLPALGVTRATALAVAGNLVAAFVAIRLGARWSDGRARPEAEPAAAAPGGDEAAPAWVPLVVLGVGGVVSLGLEVVCVHLLAVVAGNSAYAFSLMLFAFLLGLGAGAALARRWLRGARRVPAVLGLAELGLAATVLGGAFLWDRVPGYFASFALYPLTRTFGAREVVRGLVCVAAMLPPALFIGLVYPLAIEWVGRIQPRRRLEALGEAAAVNTAGNILGVLLAGFVLLPRAGPLASLHLAAAMAMALAVLAAAYARGKDRALLGAAGAVVVALALAQPSGLDYGALVTGGNVYFRPMYAGRVLAHAESLDGGLTAVIENEGPDGGRLRTLLTNGKFQGNDAPTGEVLAQYAFGLCPMLHTAERGRALVIGFGTGATARVIHDGGFARVDVVDLSADVTRLGGEYFRAMNRGILSRPEVSTYVTDGRNFVAIRDARYDLLSMEVSSIWFAGAASLYNREFYHAARARLGARGVLQQWVQLHHLSGLDLLRVIATLRSELRNVWLYVAGDQGVLVGCEWDCRPTAQAVARLGSAPDLQDAFALLGPAETMLRYRVLTPDGVDRLLASARPPASALVSTDDNLLLEYSTPRGNASDGDASYRENLAMLAAFAPPSPLEGTALPAGASGGAAPTRR